MKDEKETFIKKEHLQEKTIESKKLEEISSNKKSNIKDIQEKKIFELESLLNKIQQDHKNNILRLQAEIENMRRRNEISIEKAHKFALEHFFIELLPVIDNLERALETLNKNNKELISTKEGIELTLKSLINTVNKFGLNVIKEVNVEFNPEIHQAITMIDSKEHKKNQVINIMQKGYLLNDRLIRPAMVIVSKENNI